MKTRTDFIADPEHVYWIEELGTPVSNEVQNLSESPVLLGIYHEGMMPVVVNRSVQADGGIVDLPGGWDRISRYPITASHGHNHADLFPIAHKAAVGELGGFDSDDIIRIESGATARISSPVRCRALAVKGLLEVSADIDCETIIVYPSGHLSVTEGTISFLGSIAHDPSQSNVGIFNSGRVTIDGGPKERFGELDQRSPTEFYADFLPDAGWQVGDVLAFPDMQRVRLSIYQQRTHRILKSQIETRRIVAIDGPLILLDSPLEYDHLDTYQSKVPCGNLTSKVTLQTNPFSEDRAHAFFSCHHVPIRIRGATFKGMGRTTADAITPAGGSNQIGRYPCHAHHCDDFAFEDVAIWDSPRHGVVHHNSHGIVKGCLVVDAMASGIFAEEGGETGTWEGNTVFSACYDSPLVNDDNVFGASDGKDLGSGGFCYWMRTHNVNLINNAAYGYSMAAYASFTHKLFNKQQVVLPFVFRGNYFHGSAESVLRIQYNTAKNILEGITAWNRFENCDGLAAIHSGDFEFIGGTLGADNGRVVALNINGLATSKLKINGLAQHGEWDRLSYRFTLV